MCGKLRLTFCLPDSCVSFLIHALLPPVLLPVAHGRRLAGLLSSKWTSRTFKGVWGLAQRQLIITDSSVYVHNCHNYRGAFLDTVTPSVGKKKSVFSSGTYRHFVLWWRVTTGSAGVLCLHLEATKHLSGHRPPTGWRDTTEELKEKWQTRSTRSVQYFHLFILS